MAADRQGADLGRHFRQGGLGVLGLPELDELDLAGEALDHERCHPWRHEDERTGQEITPKC